MNNANDGSASQYDIKDKNYTCSSKKIISVHEDTYQSNFEQINHKDGNPSINQKPGLIIKNSSKIVSQNSAIRGQLEDRKYGLSKPTVINNESSVHSKYLDKQFAVKMEDDTVRYIDRFF